MNKAWVAEMQQKVKEAVEQWEAKPEKSRGTKPINVSDYAFEGCSRKLRTVATLPWMSKYWMQNPSNTFIHSQIREKGWIGRANPVMASGPGMICSINIRRIGICLKYDLYTRNPRSKSKLDGAHHAGNDAVAKIRIFCRLVTGSIFGTCSYLDDKKEDASWQMLSAREKMLIAYQTSQLVFRSGHGIAVFRRRKLPG